MVAPVAAAGGAAIGTKILAGVSIASSLFGGAMGIGGSKKAKKAAKAAAALKYMETYEEVRRRKITDRNLLGEARLAAANSGVILQGTPAQALQRMGDELERERAWMMKAGMMAATAIKKGASVQYKSDMASAVSSTVQRVSSGLQQWWDI